MVVSDKHEFVYFDIPKTASCSIDKFFKEFYRAKNYRGTRGNKCRLVKHERVIPIKCENYQKIVSVRNPYHRATSYYYYYNKREVQPYMDSFDEFMDFCISTLEHPSDSLDDSIYRYFPCWKYMEPTGYDSVVRVENIKTDLRNLSFVNKDSSVRVRHSNINRHPQWDQVKTKSLIRKINTWAGKDFELFGYEKIDV